MRKKEDSDEQDSWEDVEEDFPHVRLEELLDNLKIDDPNEGVDDDVLDEEIKKNWSTNKKN